MYLADHARLTPDKPAMIIPDRGQVTFAELDARSNQLAHLLHDRGLRRGDHIAVFMENNLRFMDAVWAAFRSGLYVTAINRYLPAEEAAYIAGDCMAKALVTSYYQRVSAAELAGMIPDCPIRLMTDGAIDGFEAYEEALAAYPTTPLAEEWMGGTMLYSSGTTGRPKGIIRPLPDMTPAEGFAERQGANRYGVGDQTVYLSPAPLYHAAPLHYVLNVQGWGGTVVMMEKFDAEGALALIERYRITQSQWVPTALPCACWKLPVKERCAGATISPRTPSPSTPPPRARSM